MANLTIQLPVFDAEHKIEIDVTINGKKKRLHYRVELFDWSSSEEATDKASCLKQMINTYDPNWQVVQDGFFMPHNRTEWDFFKTYGMEIIAGRDFSFEYATDTDEAFIINETAAARLGFEKAENAIGAPMAANLKEGKIIGVVKDINYESLHKKIVPILTYVELGQINTVAIRISPGELDEVIDYAQSVWNQFLPGVAIEYSFLDQRLDRLYRNEQRMMTLFMQFSALAVIIACLGLFGLAAFSATQRTKEIGIRKVLGASVNRISLLLSKDFVLWIILANLIAWPVAWYFMNGWLNNFAYRTEISWPHEITIAEFFKMLVQDPIAGLQFFFNEVFISQGWWVFLLSGSVALLIALLTVSFQAIKAATTNPVEALMYE